VRVVPPTAVHTHTSGHRWYISGLCEGPHGLRLPRRRFLQDIAVAKSAATVATYRSALRRFAEFLDAQRPRPADVADLTEEHPIAFARWASDHGRAPRTTVHLYTTAAMRFYAFLVRERHRSDLQLETIQLRLAALRGKRPRGLPKVPPDETIERMVAAARKVAAGATLQEERIRLRNIAILQTLRGSGVRVSELVLMRRGDLDRDQRRAVVTGKGGKQRLVFFTDEAWRAVWAYLEARGDGRATRGAGAAPLFARHDRGAGGKTLALTTKSVPEVVWGWRRRRGSRISGSRRTASGPGSRPTSSPRRATSRPCRICSATSRPTRRASTRKSPPSASPTSTAGPSGTDPGAPADAPLGLCEALLLRAAHAPTDGGTRHGPLCRLCADHRPRTLSLRESTRVRSGRWFPTDREHISFGPQLYARLGCNERRGRRPGTVTALLAFADRRATGSHRTP
jgi:integrase/recombinase XerC